MFRSILVPIDLDEPGSSAKALLAAVALRDRFDASLALMTVVPDLRLILDAQWSPIGYEELVDKARVALDTLADTLALAGSVDRHVETGTVYTAVLSVAERIGADLVVLGAHRPAMRDYLLGSNASRVVRHAGCSVLVVRD